MRSPVTNQPNILNVCLNLFTRGGKKCLSEKLFFGLLAALSRHGIAKPHFFVLRVVHSIRPQLGLKSKQIAGSRIRFPAPLPVRQQYLRSLRWLVEGAAKRDRFGRLRTECLADEFLATAKGQLTYSRKQLRDLQKFLRDNRASVKFL
jgi:ribosomal protein S7